MELQKYEIKCFIYEITQYEKNPSTSEELKSSSM